MFLCCFYGPYLSVSTGRVFDHRLFHRICSYAVFTDPTFLFPQDGCLTIDFFTGYVLMLFLRTLPFCFNRTDVRPKTFSQDMFFCCFYSPYLSVPTGRPPVGGVKHKQSRPLPCVAGHGRTDVAVGLQNTSLRWQNNENLKKVL